MTKAGKIRAIGIAWATLMSTVNVIGASSSWRWPVLAVNAVYLVVVAASAAMLEDR